MRARPILTALATVGNHRKPLLAGARLHLPVNFSYLIFSIYFDLSIVT